MISIMADSGFSVNKGQDYAYNQAQAETHQLPRHEKPFLSPGDRTHIHNYAEEHGVMLHEDIMDYERFRSENSYKESTDLQKQLIEAKEQGNSRQQQDILDQQLREHALAKTSPRMTDDVREQIRQYAADNGADANVLQEWEQHRRYRNKNIEARAVEARAVEARKVRRATLKKIATRTGLGLGGAALVGGGLYLGSKYGNFSLNPADWFHHK